MILTELVSFLISPLGTMLMLAALALAFALIRAPRLAAMLMVLGVAWVTVWSLPTPSLWLRAQVEANYPLLPIKDLPSADAIVVLGGGILPPARKNAYPDMGKAADRIWHAARLYKAGKAPLLVLSGGSDPQVSVMTEAQAMRELLLDLGVPSQAMLLETQSRNTTQNARFTAKLLRERKLQSVLLVTSAMHMDRALTQFRAAGVKASAAAIDHEMRPVSFEKMWLPNADALDGSARAFKEIVGNWAAHNQAWVQALF